jgi:glycosyltransferase involved in cell wall biosynthesis
MPSRVEGCPNALLEAMAAGAVPVPSRIRGGTDFVVEDGVSGLLRPIGAADQFAAGVAELAKDREKLARMSMAARDRVEARFSLERMGRDYDRLFRDVLAERPPDAPPRPWSEFRLEPAFRRGWRRWVPRAVKDALRLHIQ